MRLALLIFGIIFFSVIKADEGEQLFKTTCAACHTIGKGRLVGPDLLNITEKRSQEWLIPFIKSSTSVINSGDADAIAVFKEYNNILMPDNKFSDGQIMSILNYIAQGGGGTAESETQVQVDILEDVTPENIRTGAALFTGNQPLANGGAACSSCHKVKDESNFSSGLLAKDLSETYEIMGSAGVAAILRSPPFPVMTEAYKKHALTEEEVINLTAYLKKVGQQRIYQRAGDFDAIFAFFGILAFGIILMSTIILYFKRKKFPVNRKILDRPSKVIN